MDSKWRAFSRHRMAGVSLTSAAANVSPFSLQAFQVTLHGHACTTDHLPLTAAPTTYSVQPVAYPVAALASHYEAREPCAKEYVLRQLIWYLECLALETGRTLDSELFTCRWTIHLQVLAHAFRILITVSRIMDDASQFRPPN